MDWKHLLAYITGTVDQELLLRNEYLVTENRILRNQITGRVRLTDGERKTLATIGKQLGMQTLQEVATIVKPDTILGWHRRLVAQKFDGSKHRKAPGRPRAEPKNLVGHALVSPLPLGEGAMSCPKRSAGYALNQSAQHWHTGSRA